MPRSDIVPDALAPELSIVVPVLHDTAALSRLLEAPRDVGDQWIVVNGAAGDVSLPPLRARHRDVCWLDAAPGRGAQVAAGVAAAAGAWVLVLHADTRLEAGWRAEVTRAMRTASYDWGCFRLRIDTPAWQARLIELVVRCRVRLFRLAYGDQAMFFRRAALLRVGGVPPVPLMEDVILAQRFARLGAPYRSRLPAVTSPRRWQRDGWWRRTGRNWWLLLQFLWGVPPARLARSYRPEGQTGTDRC